MNAMVNQGACDGCGLCEEICPDIFRMEKGKATIGVVQIPPDRVFSCYLTAQRCPVQAIVVGEAQALMLADRYNERPAWIAL